MHRLFGKKKVEAPPVSLDDASGGLNKRLENVEAKIKSLDAELMACKVQLGKAKGSAKTGIQRRAMDILKRKKMYEQQRDQLSAQSFNIDQTSFAIESIKSNQQTVAAMKEASKQLKLENKKINLNELEDMQDDMADMFEDMEEVNEILGRSIGMPMDIDEADLDAELAALGDEFEAELGEEAPAVAYPNHNNPLPNAPTNSLPAHHRQQEQEFGLIPLDER